MQNTGTLKKRKKRNIAKVNGLGMTTYDESQDNFTGRELFADGFDNGPSRPFSTRTDNDTRLRFSAKEMVDYRREASALSRNQRVTRDPSFHMDDFGENAFQERHFSQAELDLGPFESRRRLDPTIKDREYFLDKYTMQRLKQLMWLGITTGSFPWYWNGRTHTIDLWPNWAVNIWWVQWFFVSIQTFCIMLYQLHVFLESFKHAKTYRAVFMGSFSFLWYTYCVLLNINLFFYKEKTRVYINTLLRFNHEYVRKYLIHLEDYQDGGRWVINCAIISNITQVFVSVNFFLSMSYQPWYLFHFIYPKPWYWKVPFAYQEYMVVGQVITSYMLISWIVVAHANTMKFWLTECHNNNDSDYTSDELRTPKVAFETFRSLAILNKCFNDAVAPMGIPFIKWVMSSAMVPCGYVLIRSMNSTFVEEFPGILTYPLGVLDCATAGFVILNMGSEVFDLGCSFVDSWSRTKQKDFRRILMSCSAMKFWVGHYYFMTLSTTITFFKTCFDYITDCIITFP